MRGVSGRSPTRTKGAAIFYGDAKSEDRTSWSGTGARLMARGISSPRQTRDVRGLGTVARVPRHLCLQFL